MYVDTSKWFNCPSPTLARDSETETGTESWCLTYGLLCCCLSTAVNTAIFDASYSSVVCSSQQHCSVGGVTYSQQLFNYINSCYDEGQERHYHWKTQTILWTPGEITVDIRIACIANCPVALSDDGVSMKSSPTSHAVSKKVKQSTSAPTLSNVQSHQLAWIRFT